jgi:hypothetical protein
LSINIAQPFMALAMCSDAADWVVLAGMFSLPTMILK